ncbi:MAG TPA: argininosuccinate lyase [Jiangellaceae bacterium]
MYSPEAGPPLEPPAPELVEAGFAFELAEASLFHRPLGLADLAHALVLREAGVIPAEPASRLIAVLLDAYELPAEQFPYDPAFGEIYNCRERYFVDRLGPEAGWLHAGRPRREAVRVALRLLLRHRIAGLVADTTDFVDAVCDQANRHAETLLPDQTYLQHAQPSTFGHYVLHFAYPAQRAAERLAESLAVVNLSPGGAGCVNGSRLALSRDRLAALLGFDGIIEHTRDAMWQTDGLMDLVATATTLVQNLSNLAEDLEIWDSQEFDFIALSGPYTRSSVLMPQKRNPYSLGVVRGSAGLLIGRLTGLLAVGKTPSARSDALIFAYGETPRALDVAARATRLMRGVIATLEVNAARMEEVLLEGFSQATDLTEYVMQACQLDYRSAYHAVGDVVRQASKRGLRGIDITAAMLDEAARARFGHRLALRDEELRDVLDPRAIVYSRAGQGGAAPDVVRAMAARCRAQADDLRTRVEQAADAFGQAESDLLDYAREISRG